MSSDDEFHAPRKRRRGSVRMVFFTGLLAVVVAVGALFYGRAEMVARGPLATNKIVTVKRGMGSGEIVQLLAREGAISNQAIFLAAVYLGRSSGGSLKAGEYEITAGASMAEILALLRSGKSVVYKVTIPEGWTTEQALERIAADKVLVGKISLKPGEGTLLPDTYVFERGTTRDTVITRMMKAHTAFVSKVWAARPAGTKIKTRKELVTLASIVERETGVAAERARVARVFLNRLKRGMRLQSDPTIIYGIVGGKGKMDRPLSKKDIATKTAYNTYQIDGLPPSPIANPGKAALEAVLNPAESEDLYFVADGTGGHVFATNLKDHEANVAKWRKIEAERAKAGKEKEGKVKKGTKATQAGTAE